MTAKSQWLTNTKLSSTGWLWLRLCCVRLGSTALDSSTYTVWRSTLCIFLSAIPVQCRTSRESRENTRLLKASAQNWHTIAPSHIQLVKRNTAQPKASACRIHTLHLFVGRHWSPKPKWVSLYSYYKEEVEQ